MTKEEKAILWLSACAPDAGRVALFRSARYSCRPTDDIENFTQSVIKEAENGLYNNDRTLHESEADAILARLEAKNRFAVTLASDDYPASLKSIPEPPLVLYGEGNRALLKEPIFCIVGSRITPAWAESACRRFSEELTQSFVIVTGFAEGGDSAAIAGAMPSGKLICVLPNGLDDCYPAAHFSLKRKVRERGLLLSEFPFHERLHKGSFYARNRILAGIAKGVLVVSAGEKSGTLITADYALDYGKEVFAFPHNLGAKHGAGCNALIKSGAVLTTEPEDIFYFYDMACLPTPKPVLTEEESRILEVLAASGELHAAVIAEQAGVKIYEAAATLAALEIKGLVTKSGGNKYSAL